MREGFILFTPKRVKWFKGYFLPLMIGVVMALALKTFVVDAAIVPSASMYPTIPAVNSSHFALIVVNRLSTELGTIHRGEVVTFRWPDDPSEIFVKRVIGLPGDTVKVTEHAVYINGHKLNESNMDIAKSNGPALGTFHVPPGHYFMMGDNRPISFDSRLWVHKYVARSAITGQADFVFYPLGSVGAISQSLSEPK